MSSANTSSGLHLDHHLPNERTDLSEMLDNLSIQENNSVQHISSLEDVAATSDGSSLDNISIFNSIIQNPKLVEFISHAMKRKLVALSRCDATDPQERLKACRLAISIGYRVVTKLLVKHTDSQQKIRTLWKALRSKGCQFIGPVIQDEILRLVLLALEDGHQLSRQVLIMFVMQKLLSQFPYQSKTGIGRVIQTLYRASCFEVIKREDGSSLLQLKPEFRTYEALRREHDAQIVSIGIEVGLLFTHEKWSQMLYGDSRYKPQMQSITDKLNATNLSFDKLIEKLNEVLSEAEDPIMLLQTIPFFRHLATLEVQVNKTNNCSPDQYSIAIAAVSFILVKLITFLRYLKQKQCPISSTI